MMSNMKMIKIVNIYKNNKKNHFQDNRTIELIDLSLNLN
jgi:hypothetical protein